MFSIIDSIKSSIERLKEQTTKSIGNRLTFGIDFLDHATGGIRPTDFCLLGGYSGDGKTEAAVMCALANAPTKRVHFFALEAEVGEIESRIVYRFIANHVFNTPTVLDEFTRKFPSEDFNYDKWADGFYDSVVGKFTEEAHEQVMESMQGLHTFYTGKHDINEDNIESAIHSIQKDTDLIIIDHMHYFDYIDENENRAMKVLAKKLKTAAQDLKKPVLALAHLRKRDRKGLEIFPSLDDIHGSSDLVKVSTKVILFAPYFGEQPKQYFYPTMMGVLKNRRNGRVKRYVAICNYDIRTNQYEKEYEIGKVSGKDFKPSEPDETPKWATGAMNRVIAKPELTISGVPKMPPGANWKPRADTDN